ncbi:MAG TPA: hypothetical protein VHD34_08285 [Xanthobacteraceae bacterium]|nr:hypothetical protein [Xanthobacteraceae bacterium]
MPDNQAQIGEQTAKLQNDLTPELRDKERREWRGGELMSEEQARRLREVSRKRNLKNLKRLGDKRVP